MSIFNSVMLLLTTNSCFKFSALARSFRHYPILRVYICEGIRRWLTGFAVVFETSFAAFPSPFHPFFFPIPGGLSSHCFGRNLQPVKLAGTVVYVYSDEIRRGVLLEF